MKKISPKSVLVFLLLSILLLLILHLTSYYYFHNFKLNAEDYFFKKFNFDLERNFPSIFSSTLHLISSFLLFSIAWSTLTIKKYKYFWMGLGFIFLFFFLDELLVLHEKLAGIIGNDMETSGIFYYAWVIPYGIGILILGILIIKPLLNLPKEYLIKFVIAGGIFITGALIFEMIGGWYIDDYYTAYTDHSQIPEVEFRRNLGVVVLYTIEELLEKTGIVLFIYFLLQFKKGYSTK